jgi:hypothetical protein
MSVLSEEAFLQPVTGDLAAEQPLGQSYIAWDIIRVRDLDEGSIQQFALTVTQRSAECPVHFLHPIVESYDGHPDWDVVEG